MNLPANYPEFQTALPPDIRDDAAHRELLDFVDARNRLRAKGRDFRKRPWGYRASALSTFFLVYGASIQALKEMVAKKDERHYSWDPPPSPGSTG